MNSSAAWRVRVAKRVSKVIERFPRRDYERIIEALREFSFDPWSGDITQIKGEDNLWRRRVGSYRISYSAYPDSHVVEIKEVERRTSNTY
ncbi:MAG: hypothetical protein HYV25_00050 [Candidatus Harrisonbacteria bacterium]|nr:hypothetical protein [Candidatus Harrisonbacteria bacterium]